MNNVASVNKIVPAHGIISINTHIESVRGLDLKKGDIIRVTFEIIKRESDFKK